LRHARAAPCSPQAPAITPLSQRRFPGAPLRAERLRLAPGRSGRHARSRSGDRVRRKPTR